MKRLTVHVRSRNRNLMFKKEQVEIPTNDSNNTHPEYKTKTISKIFNTFVFNIDNKLDVVSQIESIITNLNRTGYKVTKHYLSNIR